MLRISFNPPSSCSGGGSNSFGNDVQFFLVRIHIVPLVMFRHWSFSGWPGGLSSRHHEDVFDLLRRQRQCCCQLKMGKKSGGRHGRVSLFIRQYGILPTQTSSTVFADAHGIYLPTANRNKECHEAYRLTGAVKHQGAACRGSTPTGSSCYPRRRGRDHDVCRGF